MASVEIVYATRHGSTREIAGAIGEVLRDAGHAVSLVDAEDADSFGASDAVVVGSAVYMGRWLKAARKLVESHGSDLTGRPVWLFSSGPIGEPPRPEEEPENVARAIEDTGARGHEIFNGRIDPEVLTRRERIVVQALKVPAGDFRDWDRIREWSRSIAAELGSG